MMEAIEKQETRHLLRIEVFARLRDISTDERHIELKFYHSNSLHESFLIF